MYLRRNHDLKISVFRAITTFSTTRKLLARAHSTVVSKRFRELLMGSLIKWRDQVRDIYLQNRLLKL